MISILNHLHNPSWYMRYEKIFFNIVQLGAGANGGYILQHVAQMMRIFNVEGNYVLADPDVVETKNLANQLFIAKDVGEKKATVLARRYRAAYQLDISSYGEAFVEDIEMLGRLFHQYDFKGANDHQTFVLPVLIGAVDNLYTRQVMHDFFLASPTLLYLDVGVEAAWLPEDHLNRDRWTEQDTKRNAESGYTGQVVCGLRLRDKTILAPLAERFPEILDAVDEIAPSEMACSNVVSREPQRLITNKFAAMVVAGYVNELFDTGTVSNHVTLFHARKGYMRSERVQLEENNG